MSITAPLVNGNVTVTWNANNEVSGITYNGQRLIDVLNPIQIQFTPQGIQIPTTLTSILIELLDTINAIPPNRRDLKLRLADCIFGHFLLNTGIPNPKLRAVFLQKLMKDVWSWETTHELVHKGTPYFFLTREFLSQGDIPSAYVYMFNAVEEDKRRGKQQKKENKTNTKST